VTDTVRGTMHIESSQGKEIRIPKPDHPITISPTEGKVREMVAGRIVAESTQALRLKEKGYPLTSPFYWFYIVEEMKQGLLLGSLEHIVLLALARLDGTAHGMIVRARLKNLPP
jgi:hypothetical protein